MKSPLKVELKQQFYLQKVNLYIYDWSIFSVIPPARKVKNSHLLPASEMWGSDPFLFHKLVDIYPNHLTVSSFTSWK